MCLICKTLSGFICLLSCGDFFSLCVRLLVCTASAEQRSSSPPGLPAQSPPFPPGPIPNPESSDVSCAVRAGLAKCASRYDHAENMPAGLTRLTRGAAVRPGPALLSALSSRDLLGVSGVNAAAAAGPTWSERSAAKICNTNREKKNLRNKKKSHATCVSPFIFMLSDRSFLLFFIEYSCP